MENEKLLDLRYCLSLSFKDRDYLPDSPAVYVFYSEPGIVLYIGMAYRLKTRCKDHVGTFKKLSGIRVAWFPLPKELHREVEKALIKSYCPILNCHLVPRGSPHIFSGRTRQIRKYIELQKAKAS